MDLPAVVSVKGFREFNNAQKEQLYETLLELRVAVDDIPKKSLRKTLELTLAVLAYKGKQVQDLSEQLETRTQISSLESLNERLVQENEQFKQTLSGLQDEKIKLNEKIKDLADEILMLNERLQEIVAKAELSDRDSSDPLSELDKREALLLNINAKNKHIKRLLREIESLQTQNIEQAKTITALEKKLQHEEDCHQFLKTTFTQLEQEKNTLKIAFDDLTIEVKRLKGKITFLQKERERNEKELKGFVEKLEEKAQYWKKLLEEKEKELINLKKRKRAKCSGREVEEQGSSSDGMDSEKKVQLLQCLKARDKIIEEMEGKIKTMAEEMLITTELMNKVYEERTAQMDPQKPRPCCKTIEVALKAANKKCQELAELLEQAEEDSCLKAKQAEEAIKTLNAYQRGKDGLIPALHKCSSLESKLQSREKQIQALVTELNSLHEVAQENIILRKRLNIPDDAIIFTKYLAAKERNKDKLIDRLNLKLRASEEMRLQLKMDKCDLRNRLLEMQQTLPNQQQRSGISIDNEDSKATEESGNKSLELDSILLSSETNHANETSSNPVIQSPSKEIGEVDDSNNPETLCKHCQGDIEMPNAETQNENVGKHEDMIQENELLRQGMLDILEKLREYNDSSEQIIIDSTLLQSLLNVLKSQTLGPTSPTRLTEQLQTSKERERALKELLRQHLTEEMQNISKDLDEVPDIREDGEIRNIEESVLEIPIFVDSSTRPTTPNRQSFPPLEIPEILNDDSAQPLQSTQLNLNTRRKMEQELEELRIYRKHYEELQLHMKATEIEAVKTCADLTEKLKNVEIETVRARKKATFLEEDLNKNITEMKEQQISYLEREMAWKIETENLKIETEFVKKDFNHYASIYCYNKEEFTILQNAYTESLSKLAFFTDKVLKGKLEVAIPNLNKHYGIIQDDYQLDLITREEYEEKEKLIKDYSVQKLKMSRKISQLESLLELGQEQIQSQQKLLNDITDNHINLRHFVADLQSTSEEKFLIAKLQRDLASAKLEIKRLESECTSAKQNINVLQNSLSSKELLSKKKEQDYHNEMRQSTTKLRFLQKSLLILNEKYAKFTPLISLTNYICAYQKFQNSFETNAKNIISQNVSQLIEQSMKTKFNNHHNLPMEEQQQQHLIKLIKTETQCKLFEDQMNVYEKKCFDLEKQLNSLRLSQALETEHWQTIQALFGSEEHLKNLTIKTQENLKNIEQILTKDMACNTDQLEADMSTENNATTRRAQQSALTQTSPQRTQDELSHYMQNDTNFFQEQKSSTEVKQASAQLQRQTKEVEIQTNKETTAQESKAIQTLLDQNGHSPKTTDVVKQSELNDALQKFQEVREKFLQAQLTIQELQDKLKSSEAKGEDHKSSNESTTAPSCLQSDVIEKTILSFHTLLSEKDKSIGKYQDIIQTEREQNNLCLAKLNAEIERLNNTITTMNVSIKEKDLEILDLKSQLEALCKRRNGHEKLQLATQLVAGTEDNVDNSLHEMSDEKIEELFQQEKTTAASATSTEILGAVSPCHIPDNISKEIKELKEKATFWESNLKIKEDEVQILKEKIKLLQEREKPLETHDKEIEQLRQLLEEKDKHINDLLDTLNNFHDDQQHFINDASNHSADQIAQLANDISRTAATNKIYHTQVEALKKQLVAVTQREKQARDLNTSLRNQLIKRPVVSIKSELNARVKSESLQKRIQQLELDLEDARVEIQRQKALLEAKRNRSNLEVALWEKQKRWQQTAEKSKTKLEETEAALAKSRHLLQSARNGINRLEKDKQVLIARLRRAHQHSPKHTMKCCRAPSCPNLHQATNSINAALVKYISSESPEQTLTGASSTCSSPARSAIINTKNSCSVTLQHHTEIMETLKARLEMQQRKILALELRGKGGNTLTAEMEKLHEKLSAVEAQNVRLEAKNLQLQLDNDMLRQGNGSERLQKRTKHLEDYIIALKEEMAGLEARRQLCKCTGMKIQTQTGQSAECTILSLRNLVDKLKAENKFLKDGRHSSESRASSESCPNDGIKFQQMYHEALHKIEALQLELKLKSQCPHCESYKQAKETSGLNEELAYIKELLYKKSQLLQKAKILLTRAAAKEKLLKEQLMMWKRKCFELQNVPVIEEISE